MKNSKIYKESKRIIKFSLVGISNTVLTILFYNIFVFFKFNFILSNTAAYFIGILNSYIWNKNWVFKKEGHIKISYFFLINIAVTIISNCILFFLKEILRIDVRISQIFAVAVSAVINYLFLKVVINIENNKSGR